MAAGRNPGSTGRFFESAQDGTMARIESPFAGSLGVHSHGHRRHPGRLHLVLNPAGKGSGDSKSVREGKVVIVSKDPYVIWLYDFGVGNAVLGSGHQAALRQLALDVSMNRSKVLKISIDGYTSRSGPDELNMNLSSDRARAVQSFLANLVKGVTLEPVGKGESPAKDAGEPEGKENPVWRSVLICIWPPDKPKPRPEIPSISASNSTTKRFLIRVVSGYSVSAGLPKGGSLNADSLTLEIADPAERKICRYLYDSRLGGGAGVGWSPAELASGAYYMGTKKWTAFDVALDWKAEGLGGAASLTGGGVGGLNQSAGRSDFKFERRKNWHSSQTQTIPDLDLGVTIQPPGAGGSKTSGTMFLIECRQYDGLLDRDDY